MITSISSATSSTAPSATGRPPTVLASRRLEFAARGGHDPGSLLAQAVGGETAHLPGADEEHAPALEIADRGARVLDGHLAEARRAPAERRVGPDPLGCRDGPAHHVVEAGVDRPGVGRHPVRQP